MPDARVVPVVSANRSRVARGRQVARRSAPWMLVVAMSLISVFLLLWVVYFLTAPAPFGVSTSPPTCDKPTYQMCEVVTRAWYSGGAVFGAALFAGCGWWLAVRAKEWLGIGLLFAGFVGVPAMWVLFGSLG